ncbi:MAG: NADH-quinone oxidoreductase subunit L [Elusimicrobia bacterium]|nr:NADH-quinone oxidoreductase subunit L [Elusimicrobiota bacterium]
MAALPLAVVVLFAAPVAALLVGFLIVRPLKPSLTHVPILISCALVTAASVWLASRAYTGWELDQDAFTWLTAGSWKISFGVRIDGLSASVLAMVSFVGGLIHLYACGYMAEDPDFSRFFLYFHLFYLAMIGLLVSNNYVQLYLFWELVGVASYLLIGFWYHKETARRAALQAFMTNRVGDFGLMLAVLLLLLLFGPGGARFSYVFPLISTAEPKLLGLTGVLLFWAASAKSAQFPLYFWLPDAMEGPTPVSALMHAATMVTAGIFLLARSWPIVVSVPGLPELIACVGAFTAIGAAIVAGTKTDLKRILAYSTVSHLGLMAFALGLGAVGPAIFHLITHGFFKAVLFLCAGNIAHALHQSTASVDDVGDMRRAMPLTFFCFAAAALSLSGIGPFAGFFSKDAILHEARRHGPAAFAAGLAIAAGSAFYIFRMLFLTFFGRRAEQKRRGEHAHDAPPIMAVPVLFLTLGALGVGWLQDGFSRLINVGWPLRAGVEALPAFDWPMAIWGTAAALAGAGAAYWLTMGLPSWDWQWRSRMPELEAAFESDLGWKTVVALLAHGVRIGADAVGGLWDKGIWDGIVESTADFASGAADLACALATGSLNDYLWWMLAGTSVLLWTVVR